MAVAEIIGAAIGVLLLVLVAYLLVGSTLSTAELVVNAQKDMTLANEIRLRTDMQISDTSVSDTRFVNISITNTGTEIIGDFAHMDVLIFPDPGSGGYQRLAYNPDTCKVDGTWCIPPDLGIERDIIHPKQLDPGEKMWIMASPSIGTVPTVVQVATGNGVTASRMLV
jgi:flagellar protein FlaF